MEDYKKGLMGLEQAQKLRSSEQGLDHQGYLRDDLVPPSERPVLYTKIGRLAESLMKATSQYAFGGSGFETFSESINLERQRIVLDQTMFWSFLRQISDFKQDGERKIESLSR